MSLYGGDNDKSRDKTDKGMFEFFQKQKTLEVQSERSQNEQKLLDIMKEASADAGVSNFFANKVAENRDRDHDKNLRAKHSNSPVKKYKGDPRSAYSRKDITEREREQLFLQFYDESMKLRKNQTNLEQHIKELKTKLRVIEGEYVYSKKKFQGDAIIREDLEFIEDLKRENQTLKDMLKDNQLPKASLPAKTSKQKVIVRSGGPGIKTNANADHLRLIDLLKMQLKKAEQEIQALNQQKNAMRGSNVHQSDYHEKNVKIATLNHRFENLDGAFSAQKQQLANTQKVMEDVNKQLYNERARTAQLEVQLRAAEMGADTAQHYQLQVEELEREKKMLEAKYKDLVESPFFKDIGEKAANPARLREAENQLTELKAQLKNVHDKNSANEKELVELKSQLKIVTMEKEKLKDEKTRAEAILQERERTQGFMDKQMEVFNMGNEREKDNFIKALGMVRLRGDEPAWKRLEFIDRHEELDITNPTSLLKEIDRVRLEKSDLAAQLEKAQTLLHTHLEMEKEKEIIHQAELHKLQLQLKSANNRIEELVKLADFKARTYKDNAYRTGVNFKPYDDGASEFSDITESEIASTENTFDVLVRDCQLDEFVLRKLLSGKVLNLEGLQTMVAVDFYNHDTQNSEVVEGLKPNYNFQVAYRVNVDQDLVSHMENEFLRAEIYALTGSDLTLLGTCYVSYRELIIKNYDAQYGTSPVVNLDGLIYGERKSDIVGTIKFKLRMRHPIQEALHWVKERAEFIKENEENIDIRMDPTLKSRKLIIQVDRVTGLDKRAASFVYYKLYNLRDNTTPTVPGQEPVYNYISTHDLVQNEAVKKYLEREMLEFVVFDDSAPLRRGEAMTSMAMLEGMVGRGRIKLNTLLQNEPIDQVVPLQNLKGAKVGAIHVRMHWHDQSEKQTYADDGANNLTKIWEENFTHNIVAAFKLKGQSIESAFSIMDSNGNGKLTFEEFREGILRTFKVKAKEDEVGLYWRRLHLVNDQLPRDEFYLKFGPYFSREDHMRVTQNRLDNIQGNDFRNITNINQMLNKNSETIKRDVPTNTEIVNEMSRRLARKIGQRHLVDSYLERFDRDASGYISPTEMRTALASLDINLTQTEIDDLLRYFDVNQDNRISVEEFKTVVRGGILDELRKIQRQDSIKSQQSTGSEAREEVVKFIADHIQKTKQTLNQFTQKLDADNSGSITRNEFAKFFQDHGIGIQHRELQALFEELDPKNTNQVSLKRFKEVVGPYINEKPQITTGIERTLEVFGAYIKGKNLDPFTFFNKVDKDKSGFLERKELKAELQAIGILSSDIEIENLLNFLDANNDGRVNSREFANTLQPFVERAKLQSQKSLSQFRETPKNNKLIDDLKKKCHENIRKHYKTLMTSLGFWKESSGGAALIKKENFRKVFLQSNVDFIPSEVDLILDYLVESTMDGMVYYEKFLNAYNESTFDKADFAESAFLSSTGFRGDRSPSRLSQAEEVFARIRKALQENKISARDGFKIFDKDGNGRISLQEFRDAFAGMKLNFSKQEVEDIIRHIDKGRDGQINYNEFIAALKL